MYAKVTADGKVKIMPRLFNVSNATEEKKSIYANLGGYKKLMISERPGPDYVCSYSENENCIVQKWSQTPMWYKAEQDDNGAFFDESKGCFMSIMVNGEELPGYTYHQSWDSFLTTAGLVLMTSHKTS